MPLQDGVRLDEEDDLTKTSTSTGRQSNEFADEDDKRELLPAGYAWCVGVLALKDAELLAQNQDLKILVMLGSVP